MKSIEVQSLKVMIFVAVIVTSLTVIAMASMAWGLCQLDHNMPGCHLSATQTPWIITATPGNQR